MSTVKFNRWEDSNGVPMGTVIGFDYVQVRYENDNYIVNAETATYSPPALTLTYTPLYANSLLYVQASFHIRLSPNYGAVAGINRDGVKVKGNWQPDGNFGNCLDFFYKGDGTNHHITMQPRAILRANSTSPTTFTVWARGWAGGVWEYSQGFGQHMITVMEIQQ
jgi:hypothetical protein